MEKLKEIFYNQHMINTETTKKQRGFLLLIIYSLIFILGCTSTKTERIEVYSTNNYELSLRQKIGQLFVIRPEAINKNITLEILHSQYCPGTTEITPDMQELYQEYPAGGFCIFDRNIKNPDQIKKLNSQIHKLFSPSPLIFIDEEGGPVSRIANNKNFEVPQFKNMGEIGKSGKTENAYMAGYKIGNYLKEYGFNVDFAPIADVNTNPKNPIIGSRAFSQNPDIAAQMDISFLQGLHDNNIYGCLKHFPGHGDTQTDTHKGYAETTKNWNELKNCEMITFQKGIDFGVQIIMTAHIAAPKVTGTNEPATISSLLLTEKLRGEMGYKGIIITDAMEMGAIRKEYNSAEAAVRAIEAGADIILMPFNYREAFEGIFEAVKSGRISEKRIDESVNRILALKSKVEN